MNCQKPIFSVSDASVISTVRGLHSYFRDLQAYYKVLKSHVISELEYNNKPETINDLKNQLNEIDCKLRYIHVLNNSASTVDEVIHLAEIRDEFCLSKQTVEV